MIERNDKISWGTCERKRFLAWATGSLEKPFADMQKTMTIMYQALF